MKITACCSLLLLSILTLGGCARVPPESAQLSIELGKQLSALEQSHLALLDSFFAEKERQVDRFIEERWAPEFTRNFLNSPQLAAKWEQVSHSGGPDERLQFLTELSPLIQERIVAKRLQLLEPLNDIKRHLQRQLQQDYAQARSINSALTQLLSSAATVEQNRLHYQQLLGIEAGPLQQRLDQVDQIVGQLNGQAKLVDQQVDQAASFVQALQQLKEKLSGQGGD